jgi:hypothetical protein
MNLSLDSKVYKSNLTSILFGDIGSTGIGFLTVSWNSIAEKQPMSGKHTCPKTSMNITKVWVLVLIGYEVEYNYCS